MIYLVNRSYNSGDYEDLSNLVDAFHMITVNEDSTSNQDHFDISIRLLGICYDIRHASQGDRELQLVGNGRGLRNCPLNRRGERLSAEMSFMHAVAE